MGSLNGLRRATLCLILTLLSACENGMWVFVDGRRPDVPKSVKFSQILSQTGDVTVSWESNSPGDFYSLKLCQDAACSEACGESFKVRTTSVQLTELADGSYRACAGVSTNGKMSEYTPSEETLAVDSSAPIVLIRAINVGPKTILEAEVKDADPTVECYWQQVSGQGTLGFSRAAGRQTEIIAGMPGNYEVSYQCEDWVGLKTTAQIIFDLQATGPQISFLQPATVSVITRAEASAYQVSGKCDALGRKIQLTVSDGKSSLQASPQPLCDPSLNPNWSATLDLSSLRDGVLDFYASVTDTEGVIGQAYVGTVQKYSTDSLAPALILTQQPARLYKAGDNVSLTYTLDEQDSGLASLGWAYSADGVSFPAETMLATNIRTLVVSLPSNAAAASNAKIRVKAIDRAGNTSTVTTQAFRVANRLDDYLAPYRYGIGSRDGGPDEARFGLTWDLATDGDYLYLSEESCIRRIHINTRITFTLAGNCQMAGFVDGVGELARISGPRQGTVLGDYFYFAESYQSRTLRRVGIRPGTGDYRRVTTLAGNPLDARNLDGIGLNARFSLPVGITNDGTYLYIADFNWHTIRRFDPDTGSLITLAGSTAGFLNHTSALSALFRNPHGLAYDVSSQRVYIAEAGNRTARWIDLNTGEVSSFASAPTGVGVQTGSADSAAFTGPSSISLDGTSLYISDDSGHLVNALDKSTGAVTRLAGEGGVSGYSEGTGTAARFHTPHGMVASGGYIYVADRLNHVIFRIDRATGQSIRFAGVPIGTSSKYDANESLYNSNEAQMTAVSSMSSTDGNIFYVAMPDTGTIRRIDLSGNTVTTIAGFPYDSSSSIDGIGPAARFRSPDALVKVGNVLFVGDGVAKNIRRIDLLDNSVTTVAGSGTSGAADNANGLLAQFNTPAAMVSDGTYVYISDANNNSIRRMTIGGSWEVTTIAGGVQGYVNGVGSSARFYNPQGLFLQGNSLYVADSNNAVIRKIDLTVGQNFNVTRFAGLNSHGTVDGTFAVAKFYYPRALSGDATHLYVADWGTHKVRKIDLSQELVSTVIGSQAAYLNRVHDLPGSFSGALTRSISYHAGKLFIPSANSPFGLREYDESSGFLKWITGFPRNSIYTGNTPTGTLDGPLRSPAAKKFRDACVSGGYLYAWDAEGYSLKRMNLDGSGSMTVAGSDGAAGYVNGLGAAARFGWVTSMACDSQNIYVSEMASSTIRKIALSNFQVTTLAGRFGESGALDAVGTDALFFGIQSLTLAQGDLYVADSGNQVIRKVSLQTGDYASVTTAVGAFGASGYTDGAAQHARLATPTHLTAIGDKLFIVDYRNYVIRQLDLSTSQVSTFAGKAGVCGYADAVGTQAEFCGLENITSDGQGTLFLLEGGNALIRRISVADRSVSTFAGVLGQSADAEPAPLSEAFIPPQAMIRYEPDLGLMIMNGYGIKIVR